MAKMLLTMKGRLTAYSVMILFAFATFAAIQASGAYAAPMSASAAASPHASASPQLGPNSPCQSVAVRGWTCLGGDPLFKGGLYKIAHDQGISLRQAFVWAETSPKGQTAMTYAGLSSADRQLATLQIRMGNFRSCRLKYGDFFVRMSFGINGTSVDSNVTFLDPRYKSGPGAPSFCVDIPVTGTTGQIVGYKHYKVPFICVNFGVMTPSNAPVIPKPKPKPAPKPKTGRVCLKKEAYLNGTVVSGRFYFRLNLNKMGGKTWKPAAPTEANRMTCYGRLPVKTKVFSTEVTQSGAVATPANNGGYRVEYVTRSCTVTTGGCLMLVLNQKQTAPPPAPTKQTLVMCKKANFGDSSTTFEMWYQQVNGAGGPIGDPISIWVPVGQCVTNQVVSGYFLPWEDQASCSVKAGPNPDTGWQCDATRQIVFVPPNGSKTVYFNNTLVCINGTTGTAPNCVTPKGGPPPPPPGPPPGPPPCTQNCQPPPPVTYTPWCYGTATKGTTIEWFGGYDGTDGSHVQTVDVPVTYGVYSTPEQYTMTIVFPNKQSASCTAYQTTLPDQPSPP